MLPKSERITTKRFDEILKNGTTIRGVGIYAKYLPHNTSRFAVVIPKKVVKGAVQRHFLKRYLFSIIKKHKQLFPNMDITFFTTKEIKEIPKDEYESLILELSKKVAS